MEQNQWSGVAWHGVAGRHKLYLFRLYYVSYTVFKMPPKRKATEDANKQTVYVLKSHTDDVRAENSSDVVAVYANETRAQIAAIVANLDRHFIGWEGRDLKAVSPTLEKYFAQSSDGDEQCIPTKIKDYAKVIKKNAGS